MSQAISEKRQQQLRPGGCVGVFFHLFDWKNRLAKRRLLFTKRLLPPPTPTVRNIRKPSAEERPPNLLLIAEENRCEPEPAAPAPPAKEMRPPGLVARLMGLDSMPAAPHDKLGKGIQERRPVGGARFSPESLAKGMLSRTKSQSQPRQLPSPVKSPKRSGKARLMQVATKILEPGLQPRGGRARHALTCNESGRESSPNDPLLGSCRSCGSLVQASEVRLSSGEPVVKECAPSSSSQEGSVEIAKAKPPAPQKSQKKTASASLAVQAKINVKNRACNVAETNHQGNSEPQLTRKNSRQGQSPLVKENAVLESKGAGRRQTRGNRNESNGPKDFVASNTKLSNPKRLATNSSDKLRVDRERNGWEESIPRRRNTDVAVNNTSTLARRRTAVTGPISRKGAAPVRSRPTDGICVRSELRKKSDGDASGCGNDNDIVSFMFSSPMRHGPESSAHPARKEHGEGSAEVANDTSPPCGRNESLFSQRGSIVQGDELSNLLEQKIRELASLEEEGSTGDALPSKSTARILQELMSALTSEASVAKSGRPGGGGYSSASNTTDYNDLSEHKIVPEQKNQEKATLAVSTPFSVTGSDHPSPVSILQVSFSNDSCSVGSASHNSVSGTQSDSRCTEKCDTTQKYDLDIDLLDSATSTLTSTQGCHSHLGISQTKLCHGREAMSTAELLFDNISLYESDGAVEVESSIDIFLLSMLETIMDDSHRSPKFCPGFTKDDQLRGFLFDCIIECLESKYDRFCKSGYRAWSKLSVVNREQLLAEIHEELRRWNDLAGQSVDDFVEKEMSYSETQWADCETEVFETGNEIQDDILYALVDEAVIDLSSVLTPGMIADLYFSAS